MTYLSKLTTKSQITVPKDVRAALGVGPGERVKFDIGKDGRVALVAADGAEERERRKLRIHAALEALSGKYATGRRTNDIMRDMRGDWEP